MPADTASAAQGWRAFSIAVPWSTDRLGEIGGIIELEKVVVGPVDKALVLEVFCIQQQSDRVIIDGVIANARNMAMRFVLRGGVREEFCTLGQHHRRFIVFGGHFVRHGGDMLWEPSLVERHSCAVLPFPLDAPCLRDGCDAIDLFSGIRGGHFALESAGIRVAAAVDNGVECAS